MRRASMVALSQVHAAKSVTASSAMLEMPKKWGLCPYRTSKGDVFSVEWYDVLYQNSANASHSTHLLGQLCTKHLR